MRFQAVCHKKVQNYQDVMEAATQISLVDKPTPLRRICC